MKVARRVLKGPRRSNAPGLPDGATADRVFTLGDDGDLDHQAAYTALSRGRLENRLYMLEPDPDLQGLLEPNPKGAQRPQGREQMLDHAERALSRDRSQHLASTHLDPHAAELLAALPEPDPTPAGHTAADLLAALPEPARPRTHRTLAEDLLAELPDPVDDCLADQVADITARLDRLQHHPPAVDDGHGIGL